MVHKLSQLKHKHNSSRAVKVKHTHVKPRRKRHYALLLTASLAAVALLVSIALYFNRAAINQAVASQTIASMFGNELTGDPVAVSSSHGFTASYNPKQYYVSAVDSSTGDLYVGDEVATRRSYDVMRFSQQATGRLSTNSIMLNYYHKEAAGSLADIEQRFVVGKLTNPTQITKGATTTKKVHDIEFQRTEWTRKISVKSANITVTFVSYAAVVHDHPMTIISYLGDQSSTSADAFVEAMSFESVASSSSPVSAARSDDAKHALAVKLLDTMLGTQPVSAAGPPSYTMAERVNAANSAAVVKIYNILVADLSIDGKVLVKDYVTGGTGSGFIVSSDGYIGTNGHVVVNDPKDTTIYGAILLAQNGDSSLLEYLLNLTSLTVGDLAGVKNEKEALKVIVKGLYDIPSSHFSFDNKKENLLIGLGDQQIDTEELLKSTEEGKSYTATATIKHAKLIDSDYEGILLPTVMKEFKKSDVALLKLESGRNYPMVKLGSYDTLSQGENLNIVGFPGVADGGNGIVSKTVGSATLTTGKISSLKKDSGGHNLIETDTVIGHGNSGGPAFDDSGTVVGLATYESVNDADKINYVRDIADFRKLADKASVNYATMSATQLEWNKAIDLFYRAHYKSAIPHFKKVQSLYPDHPKVAAMIASSNKHIENGENIDEFPIIPVVIGLLVAVLGVGVAVVFIVLHKRGHKAYVHGVNSGQIQPMSPGAMPQTVTVPATQPFSFAPVAAPQQPSQNPPSAPQAAAPSQYTPQPLPQQQVTTLTQPVPISTPENPPGAANPAPQPQAPNPPQWPQQ